MAIKNDDGTFTMNKDMSGGQFLEYLFNPFAKNYSKKETEGLSLNEVNSMLEGERQADAVIKEFEMGGPAPTDWNEAAYGDFGTYAAERNKKKQQGTLTFSEGVLPFLDSDQLNKFYPDIFKDALKQDGNEDFKRINLGDLKNSAQRGEDGRVVYNPSVTTMVPNEDGTFAIRENDVTMDGRNQSDGGESMGAFTVRGSDLDVIYDAKKAKLFATSPPGTEQGIRMMNQITSRNLTIDDVLNSYSEINNPATPRETVIQTIAGLSDEFETNKQTTDEIQTTGGTGDSLVQTWSQVEGNEYADKLKNFLAGERVIEVDGNNFSETGFSLDGKNAKGGELINQLKAAKGYVVDGVKAPYLSGGSFMRPEKDILKLLDNFFQQGRGQNFAEGKAKRRKELLGKDYDLQNVEEAFTEAQWNSLDEGQKKEAVALLGEMAVNNTETVLNKKIGEIKKGPSGLSTDESRIYITNNKIYREFATSDNLNIMLKNPVIAKDFKDLSPQDFTNKYTIEQNGKRVIDESKVLGNEVPPEAKKVLKEAITKEQVDKFAELIEKNDIEGITKLANSINISEEDNKVLTEALVKVGGDFRKMTRRNADIEIVRSYVLSSLATFPKTAPLAPYLTNISVGTFIETGMLNTQGTDLASQIQQDARLNRSSIPEVEFSQPFSDAYSELRDINKEARTGKLENPEMKWQESTKALANMKAQMGLGTGSQQKAMKTAYFQEFINVLKEVAASVEPSLWDEITTLTFARGGQFKLFGNEVDAIAERNKNGEITGLRIGDTSLTVAQMRGLGFAPEFINAFVAAGDRANRKQPPKNP